MAGGKVAVWGSMAACGVQWGEGGQAGGAGGRAGGVAGQGVQQCRQAQVSGGGGGAGWWGRGRVVLRAGAAGGVAAATQRETATASPLSLCLRRRHGVTALGTARLVEMPGKMKVTEGDYMLRGATAVAGSASPQVTRR